METYFLTSSPFHLVKTDFLSSGNSGKSFWDSRVADFFLRKAFFLLVETDFLTSGSFFFFIFPVVLIVKVIFCLAETYF